MGFSDYGFETGGGTQSLQLQLAHAGPKNSLRRFGKIEPSGEISVGVQQKCIEDWANTW